jgi:predicted PurR-regulated permease PerM
MSSVPPSGPVPSPSLATKARPSGPEAGKGDLSTLRRSALLWGRAAAVLITVFLAYQVFLVARGVLTAVLSVLLCAMVAVVISFLGSPLVKLLQERAHVPRTLAVLLTMVIGLGLIVLVLWLASGPLVTEGRGLAARAPSLLHRLDRWVSQVQTQLRTHGVRINAASFVTSKLASLAPKLTGLAVSGVTGFLGVVVDVVIAVVLSFWLMRDGAELRQQFLSLFPTRAARELEFGMDAFSVVVGGYVRAQLFLAVVVGAMAGLGTAVLGVPFPLVVALAAGIFELIPLVGPFAGGAVALLLAFTKSPTLALFTLILFLAIHVVEGYLLVPRIQARFVQLHPVLTLLALFAGVEVGGFLGALVAVPAASYLTVLIRAGVGDWRAQRPDLYASTRQDSLGEIRNRRLLRSFRIFKRRPDPSTPDADPASAPLHPPTPPQPQ